MQSVEWLAIIRAEFTLHVIDFFTNIEVVLYMSVSTTFWSLINACQVYNIKNEINAWTTIQDGMVYSNICPRTCRHIQIYNTGRESYETSSIDGTGIYTSLKIYMYLCFTLPGYVI